MRPVENIVRGMPDQMRRCYVLRKVYQMRAPEIAERLHLSLDVVEHELELGARFVANAMDPQ